MKSYANYVQLTELSAMQDDLAKIICLSDHLAKFASTGAVGQDDDDDQDDK